MFNARCGIPPWTVDFRPTRSSLPHEVDFAVVGGGFTGLSAAAWLRRMEPRKSVALFESGLIGAGSSGHTGGMALTETSAGDLPGLGEVLSGFSSILNELSVDCDLSLPWSLGIWSKRRVAQLLDFMERFGKPSCRQRSSGRNHRSRQTGQRIGPRRRGRRCAAFRKHLRL